MFNDRYIDIENIVDTDISYLNFRFFVLIIFSFIVRQLFLRNLNLQKLIERDFTNYIQVRGIRGIERRSV